jgi:hypothetical protein
MLQTFAHFAVAPLPSLILGVNAAFCIPTTPSSSPPRGGLHCHPLPPPSFPSDPAASFPSRPPPPSAATVEVGSTARRQSPRGGRIRWRGRSPPPAATSFPGRLHPRPPPPRWRWQLGRPRRCRVAAAARVPSHSDGELARCIQRRCKSLRAWTVSWLGGSGGGAFLSAR